MDAEAEGVANDVWLALNTFAAIMCNHFCRSFLDLHIDAAYVLSIVPNFDLDLHKGLISYITIGFS